MVKELIQAKADLNLPAKVSLFEQFYSVCSLLVATSSQNFGGHAFGPSLANVHQFSARVQN